MSIYNNHISHRIDCKFGCCSLLVVLKVYQMITINLMDILTTLSKTKIIMISLFKKMSNNSSVALHSLKKKNFTPNFHEEQITLLIFFKCNNPLHLLYVIEYSYNSLKRNARLIKIVRFSSVFLGLP